MGKNDDCPSPTPSSSPPSPSPTFHPALAVTNIKNQNVLDHIDPKIPKLKDVDDQSWKRLDYIVKQWIYGTISEDLLQTILVPDSMIKECWDRLRDIFQENKHTRAVYLENKFVNTFLKDFPNISAFCQQLKSLSDQLTKMGNKFNKARSMLCIEETSHSQQSLDSSTGSVLVAPSLPIALQSSSMPPHTYIPNNAGYSSNALNYSCDGGKNRGRGKKSNWCGGRVGRNTGKGAARFNFQQDYGSRPYGQSQHQSWVSPWGTQQQLWGNWASPPAPYPSAPYQQQQR
ncbi:hypothetical protein AgCh_021740 [Apium graveolens]